MSPTRASHDPAPRSVATARRLAVTLGVEIRNERLRLGWTLTELACRAGVSLSMVHGVESGEPATVGGYARLATALGSRPSFSIHTRARRDSEPDADPVHAAMGELEAGHLRVSGHEIRLDEPYQHYQFAGRADVVAIDRVRCALLHVENRTRFPDIQAFLGSFNAKCAYLPDELARRLGLPPFLSVTNVVVALWSAEVIHTLRLRVQTFGAACPDSAHTFRVWWDGGRPATAQGQTRTLVLLDPTAQGRQRPWVGLEHIGTIKPRHRGYADAVAALRLLG